MLFFDTLDRGQVTHVAVFLGEGKFAHASSSKGVTRAVLSEKYYQRAYWGSRRILGN
jgi:cell wall-associated NlpC family hydrolase